MEIINKTSDLRRAVKKIKKANDIIAFVPTMGALHDGHLKLVKEAKKEADIVLVSIFVNPTQFGANEDLDKYPRDLKGDSKKLENLAVDIIFYPEINEIYPKHYQTTVSLSKITKGLCGDKRLGHFDGVATIVLKLFNIVTPDIAFFGLKDYQQFRVISQMIKDLNLNIKIHGVDIVREPDGLAMSSRNLNLTPKGRKKAPLINKILTECIKNYKKNEENFKDSKFVINFAKKHLEQNGFTIDYIEIRDRVNLLEMETINDDSMIFIATFIDNVRLIDNYSFGVKYE